MRKRSFRRMGGSGEWEAQLGTELYAPEVSSSLPSSVGNEVFFVFCIEDVYCLSRLNRNKIIYHRLIARYGRRSVCYLINWLLVILDRYFSKSSPPNIAFSVFAIPGLTVLSFI